MPFDVGARACGGELEWGGVRVVIICGCGM